MPDLARARGHLTRAAVLCWRPPPGALALVLVGALTLLLQVALLRELQVALFGSELALTLALGTWLLGTAAGALVWRPRWRVSEGMVGGLVLGVALVVPALVALCRGLGAVFGAVPGTYLPLWQQVAGMGAVLLPVAVLLGLLFRAAALWFIGAGRTLAAAYATECIGSVLGGLASTLLLFFGVSNLAGVMVVTLACAGCGVYWQRGARAAFRVQGGLVVLLLAVGLVLQPALDLAMTRFRHPRLVATADTPYGRVSITQETEQTVVFVNDALVYETQSVDAEPLLHLAALQHPAPKRFLIIGGGFAGLVAEARQHRPTVLDSYEIDGAMVDQVRAALPEADRRAWSAPPAQLHIGEPKELLAQAERYDVIVLGVPQPDSGQSNRFFTEEFFRLCKAHLAKDGVLALRLGGAENLLTPALLRRTASIVRALEAVFAHTFILPGTTQILLASPAPLAKDSAIQVARYHERGLRTRLVTPRYIEYITTNDRVAQLAQALARTEVAANRDTRPACYQYTLLLWLSQFYSRAGSIDLDLGGVVSTWWWLLPALALVLAALARKTAATRRMALALLAGGYGMVLESVLVLYYQTTHGVLYRDLGLLLTAFMAGLALGAYLFRPVRVHVLIVALALASLAFAAGIDAGVLQSLSAVVVALVCLGALVAAAFAQASRQGAPDQAAVTAPLYALDVIGGALGAWLSSLLLVPALGLVATLGVTAAVALAFLLLAL